ncbi:MAG: hypothetical protein KDB82_04780 [Planctomycetes bacterium]|nr:hypothetical protein [Planctomycetota bacterium]
MPDLVYRHWNEALDPEVCVSVDGNAPGRLNLSHWPGNRTPERFRHDLSTGMCIKVAEAEDRLEVLEGFTTVTNNHWDTDGACSVFAMVEPAQALLHGQTLLAAAIAGDFGQFTTPEGVKLDLTLTALSKHRDSPVASGKFAHEQERRQAQYEFAIELLPRLLANPDLHADWFAREFWTIQQDLRALREADVELERFDALDFAVVTTDRKLHEYAVNTAAGCDRILTIEVDEQGGYRYELRLTTLSWFDLESAPPRTRLPWQDLADELNAEGGGVPGGWQAGDLQDPTPVLAFTEESGRLAPCTTRPDVVKRTMARFFSAGPYLPAGI